MTPRAGRQLGSRISLCHHFPNEFPFHLPIQEAYGGNGGNIVAEE